MPSMGAVAGKEIVGLPHVGERCVDGVPELLRMLTVIPSTIFVE